MEKDALVDSLNTESSVEQLMLYEVNQKEFIYVSTHTHEVQLWKTEETQPYIHFTREDLSKGIKVCFGNEFLTPNKLFILNFQRKSMNYCYVAGGHMTNKTDLMLLLGSSTQKEECFRSLYIKNKQLQPKFNFAQNKQLVRCSWYNKNVSIL